MESNVFVNNHIINTKQGKSNNEFQLVINLFDKKGEEFEFCSSFMKTEQFSSYENSVLKALNSKNWLQVVHNEPLHILKTVVDKDANKLVGLETNVGLILKNIVKFY